jgi:serine/threonine-protein kinase
MAVIAQHVSGEPKPPRFKNSEVSPTLETLILSLLAKSPDERPVSGEVVAGLLRDEVARELKRSHNGVGVVLPVDGSSFRDEPTGLASLPAKGLMDTPSGPLPRPESTFAETPAHSTAKVSSPLAREMLETVLARPLVLSPSDRYLCGHYLAYLLGGSRRRGLLLRRPLDPRNADRSRLLLAMTWLMTVGSNEENITRAAQLLDERPEIRPALNPVLVIKYLASRDTPAKRKKFRQSRKALQEASEHARKQMLDVNGVLNPGLMPQTLEDLRIIAPDRDEIDDQLVGRWNRVSEVWRNNADFRRSVLQYATKSAYRDPASADLWPEVVYPLIERARWQRQFRPRHEMLWDYLSAKVLHVPDAGMRLDRAISRAVPPQVAEMLDEALASFVEDPRIGDDEAIAVTADQEADRLTARVGGDVSLHDLAIDQAPRDKGLVRLTPLDPYRFTQADLRDLWREAMAALGKSTATKPAAGQRTVPVGPYRLAVIPSIRGRSAGQVALQGMANKQIEMITPSIRAGGASTKPVIAVWIYQDGSVVVVYLDFKTVERFILWHAPNAQQFNYDDGGELNHMLYNLGMEIPDQLDRVLSKKFRPHSPA